MGAAFLQHRVQELEHSVETLSFKRNPNLFDPNAPNPSFRGGRSRGQRRGRGRGRGQGRGGAGPPAQRSQHRPNEATRLLRRLVDVSVLVHGLPLVREWVREGQCQVIVPLNGESVLYRFLPIYASDNAKAVITILDMLKKAPAPLCHLAREATRYLDAQFERNNQQAANEQSSSRSTWKPRIVAQEEREQVSMDELIQAYTPPPPPPECSTSSSEPSERPQEKSPSPDEDHPEAAAQVPKPPSVDDIPRYLRPTLQCALYFERHHDPSEPFEVVYCLVGDPPPPEHHHHHHHHHHNHHQQARTTEAPPPPERDFSSRASGHELRQYAQYFQLNLHEITTKEIDESELRSKEWHRQHPPGHQRGSGGGGGGGSGKKGKGELPNTASSPPKQRKLYVP
jgi:hypothetical protein